MWKGSSSLLFCGFFQISNLSITILQLIQIYHLTGQLEEAVERCVQLRERFATTPAEDQFVNCIFLLHASSLLKLAQQSIYSRQLPLLNQFFAVIAEAIAKNGKFSTVFKLAADSLMLASKFHSKSFANFLFPASWKISSPVDAINMAAQFCCIVAKFCPSWPGSWNDLGIVLTKKSKAIEDASLAVK